MTPLTSFNIYENSSARGTEARPTTFYSQLKSAISLPLAGSISTASAENMARKSSMTGKWRLVRSPNASIIQSLSTLSEGLAFSGTHEGAVQILASSWHFVICLAMFGGWFTSPSTNDSNFLRVANTFTSRRLSDNTLMTPKIRIAPSCASSPGGTPGGGLPIRRHSSTGPQERRGSNINLSPPTVHISQMPIARFEPSTSFAFTV